MYVQVKEVSMDQRVPSTARRHPTRHSRCRRLLARTKNPETLLRLTRALPAEGLGQQLSDYTISCPASRAWLLARCQSIAETRLHHWPS